MKKPYVAKMPHKVCKNTKKNEYLIYFFLLFIDGFGHFGKYQ
jgi:hypothetical protein